MRWFVASSLTVCLGSAGGRSPPRSTVRSSRRAPSWFSRARRPFSTRRAASSALFSSRTANSCRRAILARLDAAKVIADKSILEHKLIELTAEKAVLRPRRRITDARADLPAAAQQAGREHPARGTGRRAEPDERAALDEIEPATRSSKSASARSTRRSKGSASSTRPLKEEIAQAADQLADQRMLESKGLIRRPVLRQTERCQPVAWRYRRHRIAHRRRPLATRPRPNSRSRR